MKKLPWLEMILVAILLLMIASSISALFGQDIRQAVDNFCTEQELWCAPPTPTPTLTPTPTATPLPTRTPLPTATPDSTPALESTPAP